MTTSPVPPLGGPSTGKLTEEKARKRVRKEREFYGHLATFLVVNAFLAGLNLLTSPGHFWFVYPLLGWGLGLISHAMSVFGTPGLGRGWEERRLRALTGADTEVATTARLRRLLDEELDERALPAASEAQSLDRLQRRIEHLEAIVTSRNWDLMAAEAPPPAAPAPRLPLEEEEPPEETPEAHAARLARRVRWPHLALHVRRDRFSEGHLADILRRLQVLARADEGGR